MSTLTPNFSLTRFGASDSAAMTAKFQQIVDDIDANIKAYLDARFAPKYARSNGMSLAANSVTLQNVTGLSVPVVANATYVGYANLAAINAATTTEDVKWAFNAPAGATLDSGWTGPDTGLAAAAGSSLFWHRPADTAFPTPAVAVGVLGAAVGNTATFVRLGLTTGVTAGNLQVMAAQSTSGPGVVTVVAGSHLALWRVA